MVVVLFTDRAKHSREGVLRISNYFQYGGRNRFQLVRIIATENGKLGTHDVEDAHILVHDVSILSKRGYVHGRKEILFQVLPVRLPSRGRVYSLRIRLDDPLHSSSCNIAFPSCLPGAWMEASALPWNPSHHKLQPKPLLLSIC